MAAPGGPGRVIALNGASSAGKTSIGAALQARLPGPWLLLGVDTFLPLLGAEWLWVPMEGRFGRHGREGIRFDPAPDGTVTVTLGPAGRRLMDGCRTTVAALIADGHDLVLDLVLLDADDRDAWRTAVAGADVWWIGVGCDLALLEARERDRGDRVVGLARAQAGSVHRDMTYDVVVDTGAVTADEAAAVIIERLGAPPATR